MDTESNGHNDSEQKRSRAALDGKRLNAFALDPDKVVIIGLDTDDGKEHYLWDERANDPLDENMVRNIMVNGVLQAIIVQKDGDRVLVVAGRQRVKNAREANRRLAKEGKQLIEVPAFPRRGDDADLFGVFVSENEHRRGDSPLVRAAKAQRLLNMGKTEDEVAIQFGLTKQHLGYLLKLLELSPKVRKAVDEERLSAAAAMQLHGLERAEQEAKLEALVAAAPAGKKVTTKAAKQSRDGIAAPSKRRILAVADHLDTTHAMLLSWAMGQATEKDLLRECPRLASAFEKVNAHKAEKVEKAKKKAKAKK